MAAKSLSENHLEALFGTAPLGFSDRLSLRVSASQAAHEHQNWLMRRPAPAGAGQCPSHGQASIILAVVVVMIVIAAMIVTLVTVIVISRAAAVVVSSFAAVAMAVIVK